MASGVGKETPCPGFLWGPLACGRCGQGWLDVLPSALSPLLQGSWWLSFAVTQDPQGTGARVGVPKDTAFAGAGGAQRGPSRRHHEASAGLGRGGSAHPEQENRPAGECDSRLISDPNLCFRGGSLDAQLSLWLRLSAPGALGRRQRPAPVLGPREGGSAHGGQEGDGHWMGPGQ